MSETYTSPVLELTAMSLGELKDADAHVPSAHVAVPLPASVLTQPLAVETMRMRWLFVSV